MLKTEDLVVNNMDSPQTHRAYRPVGQRLGNSFKIAAFVFRMGASRVCCAVSGNQLIQAQGRPLGGGHILAHVLRLRTQFISETDELTTLFLCRFSWKSRQKEVGRSCGHSAMELENSMHFLEWAIQSAALEAA